jgi:hypothetical protein
MNWYNIGLLLSSRARDPRGNRRIGNMPGQDSRVDEYIAGAADFAQPILRKMRELVHKACPAVEETMKWSFPHFEYKGILCSMASFKHHCSFSFWKAAAMKDPCGILHKTGESGMGHLGKLRSLDDLPEKSILISYVKHAATLNDEGSKNRRPKKPANGGSRQLLNGWRRERSETGSTPE